MKYINELLSRISALAPMKQSLYAAVEALCRASRTGNTILTCGNGGSAADAEHIVGELMKGFLLPRKLSQQDTDALTTKGCPISLAEQLQKGIRAISLVAGVSLPTAFANDVDPTAIFAQQIYALGKQGDVLIAISTSGNSANILSAAQVAQAKGVTVISMTGESGGKLKEYTDILLNVPHTSTPLIQELHLPVYHAICAQVEHELFG